MNKTLLKLGRICVITIPITIMLSCSTNKTETRKFGLLPTYTGQADQMIALGIKADYYPLQLNRNKVYDYLSNPTIYMQLQDKDFQKAFATRIFSLIPFIKGESWWNQEALASNERGSDPVYWKKQEGKVLLYEHYLLDDNYKIIDTANAPKHNPAVTIKTNFRASRDPYTRIPKAVFFGWDLTNDKINEIINTNKEHIEKHNDEEVVIDKKAAKIIKNLRDIYTKWKNSGSKKIEDWLYNDYYFVDSFHRMYLDNDDFQKSSFKQWLIDSTKNSPFKGSYDHIDDAKKLKQLFDASTFQSDEIKAGIGPSSSIISPHHPIYEQQNGEVGSAPMFEGSMRDNMLYLFNIAWQLSNLANYGTPFGKQHINDLEETINKKEKDQNIKIAQSKFEANEIQNKIIGSLKPEQIKSMKQAFQNAEKISEQLLLRMQKMKNYFKYLNADGKVFGVITLSPGYGESTIQSISKYSFIYKELGFKQPLPSNLTKLAKAAELFSKKWNTNLGYNQDLDDDVVSSTNPNIQAAIGKNSLFNMDDNGWFWTLGENSKFDTNKAKKFENTIDIGTITSRDDDFKAEILNNKQNILSFVKLFKDGQDNINNINSFLNVKKSDYDLWNEGLKTPFVMHMILDKIIELTETWWTKKNNNANIDKENELRKAAINWGKYFRKDFLKLKLD